MFISILTEQYLAQAGVSTERERDWEARERRSRVSMFGRRNLWNMNASTVSG